MSESGEVQQEVIHFTGWVQGVGFRYTALQIAQEFEVTGYVQNLPDRRVRVEVEGPAGEIDDFVKALEERMHGFIRRVEREKRRGPRRFDGFAIR